MFFFFSIFVAGVVGKHNVLLPNSSDMPYERSYMLVEVLVCSDAPISALYVHCIGTNKLDLPVYWSDWWKCDNRPLSVNRSWQKYHAIRPRIVYIYKYHMDYAKMSCTVVCYDVQCIGARLWVQHDYTVPTIRISRDAQIYTNNATLTPHPGKLLILFAMIFTWDQTFINDINKRKTSLQEEWRQKVTVEVANLWEAPTTRCRHAIHKQCYI